MYVTRELPIARREAMDSIHDYIMQYDGYIRAKSIRMARDAAEADELRQIASIILWQYARPGQCA